MHAHRWRQDPRIRLRIRGPRIRASGEGYTIQKCAAILNPTDRKEIDMKPRFHAAIMHGVEPDSTSNIGSAICCSELPQADFSPFCSLGDFPARTGQETVEITTNTRYCRGSLERFAEHQLRCLCKQHPHRQWQRRFQQLLIHNNASTSGLP